MERYPKGGLVGSLLHLFDVFEQMHISVYAAYTCYFIVLAVFPALLLLLGLLQYTPLEVEGLTELLQGILPDVLLEPAEELILTTYDHASGLTLGLSAGTTLWSASRGIFGLMRGLNGIYGVRENRGYIRTRVICMVYTVLFLVLLLLTLGLLVFGGNLLAMLQRHFSIPVGLLTLIDLRFFFLLAVQTILFTLMFMVLPNRHNRFLASLPGALMASAGWLVFSNLYSLYVARFVRLSNIFGSVYAVAVSMLWLYCCMSIVFYGGALNRYLEE